MRALIFNVFNTLLIILPFSECEATYCLIFLLEILKGIFPLRIPVISSKAFFFFFFFLSIYLFEQNCGSQGDTDLGSSLNCAPLESLFHKDTCLDGFSELRSLANRFCLYYQCVPHQVLSVLTPHCDSTTYSLHLHCFSCLDYCSSLWIGFPASILVSFQYSLHIAGLSGVLFVLFLFS